MNIAIVTPEFVTESSFDGGLANYVYKLATWLRAKQHNVTVVIISDNFDSFVYEGINVEKISIIDYVWRINHYTARFKLGFLFPEKLRNFIAFRKSSYMVYKALKKFNKKNKFDIVQYPHLSGYSFYGIKNVPSIVRISSSTFFCNVMSGRKISDGYIRSLEGFEFSAMKKASAVFGPSKLIAALAEPRIGKSISIIETPYVAPEAELDKSVYNSLLAGKKYVLFFGSIGLIKGIGTISEMIYSLLNKHRDLYYVFVGKQLNNTADGQDLWDHLLGKAAEFSERVIHIPAQKHSTLFPIIKHAQLITLPSLTDNFPNTCIESMANEKIVIGTKGNGFDQLIIDSESGFLVEVNNSIELLEKIDYVLRLDIDSKEKIEKKAVERTHKLHPDLVLNEVLILYGKAINDSKLS